MPAKPRTKRGRPKLPAAHARTARFTILFTPAEAAKISAAAYIQEKRTGKPTTLAEWIREKLAAAALAETLE